MASKPKERLVKIKLGGRETLFPLSHQAGIRVPKGGSSCKTCRFLGKDGKTCDNYYWVEWAGTNILPAPADEYCSDYYEPAPGLIRTGKDVRDVKLEDLGL